MKLAKQQAELAKWVLNPNAKGTPNGLAPIKDLSAHGGATLYRNSILEVEIRALMITFPIVLDLVGEKYFRAASIKYLRGTNPPSDIGNLDRIGDDFPQFLPTMDGADTTPYLKDVAHLELGIDAATTGPDAAPLSQQTLTALTGDPSKVACRLCPNATLVQSDFPIDAIHKAYLDGFEQELDISSQTGATSVIVWRPDDTVEISTLSTDEWTLLHAVQSNSRFIDAVEHATTAQPDLDLGAALSNAITNRWLEASIS